MIDCGNAAMSVSTVMRWVNRINVKPRKEGDRPRSDRPASTVNEYQTKEADVLIVAKKGIGISKLCEILQ